MLQKFEEQFNTSSALNKTDLARFVEENFEQEGHELMTLVLCFS